jgi:hypothetical protein
MRGNINILADVKFAQFHRKLPRIPSKRPSGV